MDQTMQSSGTAYGHILSVVTTKKKATRGEIKRVMRALSAHRMAKITPERRSEIARAAAKARWAKRDQP
jgi:hypothetical protein